MPRPSRRQEILEAATRTFAEVGYDRARTRGVAEDAGVSEAAIYRHFGSMDDLAQEVHRMHFARYARLVREAVEAGTAPAEQIRNVIRATLRRYREDRAGFVATLVRLPNFMPSLPAGSVLPIEFVEATIRQGQASGEIRAGQVRLLAAMFFGALLRPMQVAELTAPGSFDLHDDTLHDQTIEDVAMATLFVPGQRASES
jgi:AcrR family transcriptional regulator